MRTSINYSYRFCTFAAIILSLFVILAGWSPIFAVGFNGDSQIQTTFDGSPLIITTTDRVAGAISSLKWKDKEFINNVDHGRQLQYAWQINGYGECYNPTEAGSAYDGYGVVSTSNLRSLVTSATQLTTVSNPAFWLLPGESKPSTCANTTQAINTTYTYEGTLKKVVTLSTGSDSNIIDMMATVSLPTSFSSLGFEVPTAYLMNDFARFWSYNPQTHSLTEITSQMGSASAATEGGRHYSSTYPVIVSTDDSQYAMGVYLTNQSVYSRIAQPYIVYRWDAPHYVSKWTAYDWLTNQSPGDVQFNTKVIIGTLTDVTESLDALYTQSPVDFTPPNGSLDSIACDGISGWAWEGDYPNQPVEVSVYSDGNFIQSTIANISRPDIIDPVTHDNGLHGFYLPTPDILKDGVQHTITATAKSLSDAASHQLPVYSTNILTCAPLPTPTPIPGSPLGYLDAATCENIGGWSGDPDATSSPVRVDIYTDNPSGTGEVFLTSATANMVREAGVCSALGYSASTCPHGFSVATPASLKDGQPHNIYAYGVNVPGTSGESKRLMGSPKSIVCDSSAPTPTPIVDSCDPTDINRDGITNLPDYSLLAADFMKSVPTNPRSDMNQDGVVNLMDYSLLVSHLFQTSVCQ